MQYLALGAMGLPVFAGGANGLVTFASPSAGYLFGFVAAAGMVGLLIGKSRSWRRILGANLAGVAVIYLFGNLWLAGWLSLFSPGANLSAQVFTLGLLPFIGVDLAKAFVATQLVFAFDRKFAVSKA